MRPKMAIFKEEKWLCRVPKNFRQGQLIEKSVSCHVTLFSILRATLYEENLKNDVKPSGGDFAENGFFTD